MTWKGEPRRHSLARKNIRTTESSTIAKWLFDDDVSLLPHKKGIGTLYYSGEKERYWVLFEDETWTWVSSIFDKGRYPKNPETERILLEYKYLFRQDWADVESKEPKRWFR